MLQILDNMLLQDFFFHETKKLYGLQNQQTTNSPNTNYILFLLADYTVIPVENDI
jgi:hypothetical protein